MIKTHALSLSRRFGGSPLKRTRLVFLSQAFITTNSGQCDLKVKSFKEIPVATENVGNLENLQEAQKEKFQKLGPIFRGTLKEEKLVHVCDAEAIETVARSQNGIFPSRGFNNGIDAVKDLPLYALIANDYEAWKALRSPIAPTFLRPREIRKFSPAINAVAKDAVKRLRAQRNNGMVVNLKHEMDGYATENLLLMVYDERMGFFETPQNPRILKFMQTGDEFISGWSDFLLGRYSNMKPHEYMVTPEYKTFSTVKEKLLGIGEELAAGRKPKHGGREHVCLYDKMINQGAEKNFVNGLAISLSHTGIETTCSALLWCLYHFSRNPVVQEKAYNEIVKVIGTSNDDKSPENPHFIAHLPYVKAAIKESQRLKQVASFLPRLLEKDTVLCGYKIPANTLVLLWHSHLSLSSEHFDSPEEFKPERWDRDENEKKMNPFAYLPFGFGVRMCIGRRLSELEMIYGLAHIMQNFRLEYTETEKMNTVLTGTGVLMPERELPIRFVDRV